MQNSALLKEIINKSRNIVFFGGAGVSVASGLSDFRGHGGLYRRKYDFSYTPEEILTPEFLMERTEEFYRFYRENMLCPDARPNSAHIALAELEREGKLSAVVTQNIDGLHTLAGSKNVLELHGSVHRNYCTECSKEFDLSYILSSDTVPLCDRCGGVVRPDVVLYTEGLDGYVFSLAQEYICAADCLIVGGSSLTVNPAASLVGLFGGDNLVIINNEPTPYDFAAQLIIRENIEDVLREAVFG